MAGHTSAPTRTQTRTRTKVLWGELSLDAVACEALYVDSAVGDAVLSLAWMLCAVPCYDAPPPIESQTTEGNSEEIFVRSSSKAR